MSLDLTDWKNKKYQTRDGRPVRLLCVDAKRDGSIIGLVMVTVGGEELIAWYDDGSYCITAGSSSFDLVNAKTKCGGWVNIYPGHTVGGMIHKTKEDADNFLKSRIDCTHIEWEE
jgi:hypothetical protein